MTAPEFKPKETLEAEAIERLAAGWKVRQVRKRLEEAGLSAGQVDRLLHECQATVRARTRRQGIVLIAGGLLAVAGGLGVLALFAFIPSGSPTAARVAGGLAIGGALAVLAGLARLVIG